MRTTVAAEGRQRTASKTGPGLARRKGSPGGRAASIVPKMIDSTDPEETPEATAEPAGATASPSLPMPRWRRARVKGPTQEELDALPVKERLELLDQRRQGRHQTLNSIGILFGVVFTAGSLVATALSVRTTQNELNNSQQGQITDRYTKAVDQLGSTKLDIRLGGIYALERLATDSPRDDHTIYDVLCAFVRVHAPNPDIKPPTVPMADIQAALTVIGRRKPLNDGFTPDLKDIRVPHAAQRQARLSHADLSGADLSGVDLALADLSGADLFGANLTDGAYLAGVNLTGAELGRVNLTGATLTGARLSKADLASAKLSRAELRNANLTGAILSEARLTGVDLPGADLRGAELSFVNLTGANLRGANLRGADLEGAKLRGADLRDVVGVTTDEIRKQAHTDSTTRF